MAGKSKATISKEIFQKGLKDDMFPFLANLYKEGKISVKQIAKITGIHHTEIYSMLPEYIDDIDMDDKILEDFGNFDQEFRAYLKELKKKGVSLSDSIRVSDETLDDLSDDS
ncbi:MAG: hypothetical protein EU530_09850 [Promethearchaeota archaeon]|nr:MAG: hypothetical protein EU530_09850 [Candidatus Lokiarchaeota archaeon]